MIDRFRPTLTTRLLKYLFVCVALLVSAELIRRAIPMYLPRDWPNAHEYDNLADWKGARLIARGMSPYTSEGLAAIGQPWMGHPPTAPFWYLLLAESSRAVAAEISTIIFWAFLPWLIFLCVKELKFTAPIVTTILISSAAFNLTVVKYHSDAIQYSGPIAFLYVVSWLQLRRQNDLFAGMCLGAALTMKLFPGLLLVMLLLARRFRALFASVVTYLAIAVVMTRAYGIGSWYEFFRQQKGVSELWLGSNANSSLPGLVVQLITPPCVQQGVPSLKSTVISTACSLLLLGLAVWLSNAPLKRARESEASAIDVPFALFVLLSAFLNAWTWDHYFVITFQPLLILLATYFGVWRTTLRRWCEYACSTRRLLPAAAMLVVALSSILLTVCALMTDSHQRSDMANLWLKHHHPFYHHTLHVLQVANFIPWVVPILLCYAALPLSRRLQGARVPEAAVPAADTCVTKPPPEVDFGSEQSQL